MALDEFRARLTIELCNAIKLKPNETIELTDAYTITYTAAKGKQYIIKVEEPENELKPKHNPTMSEEFKAESQKIIKNRKY